MKEIWKDIPWYEWYYCVSNLWKIKSLTRKILTRYWIKNIKWKILSNRFDWKYYIVMLCKNWINYNKKVHRLVLQSFKKWYESMQVNHIDWNKLNNRLDNLEWCTSKENIRHAIDTWLKKFNKFWNHHKSKQIIQYDLNMNIINEYNSISEATISWNFIQSWISKCCLWNIKTHKWFIWKFKNNLD